MSRLLKGMKAELASLKNLGVHEKEQEAGHQGKDIKNMRWVLGKKGGLGRDGQGGGQDFNRRPREDVHASAPTPASVRIVLLRSTVKSREVATGDYGTAFPHAPVEGEVLVRPPRPLGQRGVGWRLKKALRGLRKAHGSLS